MAGNPSNEKLGTRYEKGRGSNKSPGSSSSLPSELKGPLTGNHRTTNYPNTSAPPPTRPSRGQEINSQLLRGYVRDDNGIDPGTVTSGNATPMGPAEATIVPVRE